MTFDSDVGDNVGLDLMRSRWARTRSGQRRIGTGEDGKVRDGWRNTGRKTERNIERKKYGEEEKETDLLFEKNDGLFNANGLR